MRCADAGRWLLGLLGACLAACLVACTGPGLEPPSSEDNPYSPGAQGGAPGSEDGGPGGVRVEDAGAVAAPGSGDDEPVELMDAAVPDAGDAGDGGDGGDGDDPDLDAGTP